MIRTEYAALDEVVFRRELESGLTVLVNPRKGFTKKLAYLITDFGSIHTEFDLEGKHYSVPAGVAHYLEHKLFDMPGGWDASEKFAALGAVTNAFTSYDMTGYYFSCTEHFRQCLELLVDFVFIPCFTEESVARERGIIDQEIGMNLDSPDSIVFEELMKCLYEKHPIRVPILGTSESIRQITPQVLSDCHRAFYAPGNMLLCVIGDVDPEEVAAVAEARLGSHRPPVARKCRDWQEEMTVCTPRTERHMEVAMPNFTMAMKFESTGTGAEAVRRELVAELAAEVLFGESSELYMQLYDQGLIDTSFGGGVETLDGCAMLMCSGDSRDPDAVRAAVLAQAEKLGREGIDEELFLRLRRSAMGRRIRDLDSFDSTCFRLSAYHLYGFDYFRIPEIYRQLQLRELQEFLQLVAREERCAISIIYPNIKEETP